MANKEVVLTRVFNASKDKVWKAWTDPHLIQRWWGPKYFLAPLIKNDFRIGGKYLYSMQDLSGKVIWSTGEYIDIRYLEKIVCTDSFSDDKGKIIPPIFYGMPPEMSNNLEITVLFEDEDGKTRMTLRHKDFPEGQIFDDCVTGWTESLDKFEAVVNDLAGRQLDFDI